MKAIIIGAGRIGRGFVASLLKRNQVELTFFDVNPSVVEQLNEYKTYTVHVLGNAEKDTVIDHYQAYLLSDKERLATELAESTVVFTAVGGKNLAGVGEKISEAYHELYQQNQLPKNVFITCENWLTPAEELHEAILNGLSEAEQNKFEDGNDVSQAVIRASGTSAPADFDLKNQMDTWVQDYWEIPVDQARITVNQLPDWQYFKFDPQFGKMLYQKIYTNNTSVALIAYLGSLKGYTVLSDAANDPEIVELLDQGYDEINRALIAQLQVSEESQLEFSQIAKEKYQSRTIIDAVDRIVRDPIRKLSPTDRLIGPAKMALDSGFEPRALAKAIAAALYYDNEEDPVSVKLQEMRKEKGDIKTLEELSGLKENDALLKLVLAAIDELKEKEWIKQVKEDE
ncbi:NAD-binding protein [Enterococcus sp. AZ163]|uniref:mannitol dehydrogenase family protein n=1 Tax=Enterococcus sp. AZ163 TaxID=2774638 RepID=UPI003D27BC8F